MASSEARRIAVTDTYALDHHDYETNGNHFAFKRVKWRGRKWICSQTQIKMD